MKNMMFRHDAADRSEEAQRLYARAELVYTVIDFAAALAFLVGSILFLYDDPQYAGTWCFVAGSLCFAAKPTLRLWREFQLYRMGDVKDLAERYEE